VRWHAVAGASRRLAAVLLTDMVGFSALAQRNESLALELVRRSERIIRPILSSHGGREVKTLGDGLLAEFGSALGATECAIEIQRSIHAYNSEPGSVKIDLRIGIHVGDVEHRDGDIFGDAVNIASRIEGVAEPGGVCISGSVLEQVQNKLPYPCQELERVSLKNIAQPIAICRVILPWVEAGETGLTPWTDRHQELQSIARAIDAGRREKGYILFIRGEPGIGKTRLIQEALRHQSSSGLRVLHGRALPGEPCPPYGYWAEVAREFFRSAPPSLAFKACGDFAGEITKLVPELADRFGRFPPTPNLDPTQERLGFYEGITQLFLNIARESPLLIFFDDVQWADTSSLRLLQFAAARIQGSRMVVLAACRDHDPEQNPVLEDVINDLSRQRQATSISLTRLPLDDVAKFVEFILGSGQPVPELAPLVLQKTGGNPFFVEEVLRNAVEGATVGPTQGASPSAIPELHLPENVRQVIRLRLSRLNPKTVDALRIASVIGSEFTFDLLQKATGESDDELLSALEEALQVRVVRERRVGRGKAVYAFADDQIRDSLYEELSLVRSQRYHRRVGEALESERGADQFETVEALANHFLRGNASDKALRYFVLAGDRAADLHAPEQAVSRYAVALELLSEAPNEMLESEVLERQGAQFQKIGEVEAQVRCWEKAAAGYERQGEESKAGDLLRRLGTVMFRTVGKPDEGRQLLRRALALLEKRPMSPELVRVYLDLSDIEESVGSGAEAAVFRVRALEATDRLNDPRLKIEVRGLRGGFSLLGDVGAVRKELQELLDYGLQHDPEIGLQAYWQLASLAAFGRGEFAEARDWVNRGIEFAEKTRNVFWAMTFKGVALAFVSITLGDLEAASRSVGEYHEFLEAHHRPPDGRNLRLRGEVAMLRGDFEEAERFFGRAATAGSPFQPWLSDVLLALDLARLESLRGQLVRAEERLANAMPAVRSASVKGLSWFLEDWFLALLVEVLVRQRATDRAAPFLDELRTLVTDIGSSAARGFYFRALGQCAAASGELEKAREGLSQSLDAWRECGWTLELARTQVDLAEALGAGGDKERALALIEEAVRQFTNVGAKPDLLRALATREALRTR
jgi:class 3 adenylate cyclase/tetratricopeptide (TPR) repeat protein